MKSKRPLKNLRGFFVILWLGSQTCSSLAGISILIALAQHFHHYSIPLLVQFDCFLNVSVTGLFFKLSKIICFDDKMIAKSQIDSLPAFRHLLADDTFLLLNPILPTFIFPLHFKNAFIHELFEVVTGP